MKKSFLICCSLLYGLSSCFAQSVLFDRLDINNGLSQNTVTTILQDSKGFMWFGTKDGLNRYDGKTFRIFKRDPHLKSGLRNNLIKCLAEDTEHRLWVGTDSGLYLFDPQKETFADIPLHAPDGKLITKPISVLECDKDGYVWIAVEDNGVFCHDPRSGRTECRYRQHRTLRSLRSDKNGVIWFAGYGGGLFCTKDRFEHVEPFSDDAGQPIYPTDIISFICFSDYNKMYLGLEEHGVVEVNRVTSRISRLRLSTDPDAPLFVRHILQYTSDELWIGTESGIVVYNHVSYKHLTLPTILRV